MFNTKGEVFKLYIEDENKLSLTSILLILGTDLHPVLGESCVFDLFQTSLMFPKSLKIICNGVVMVVFLLPVQSVPITTKIMTYNPAHGGVYLIQHYVIKFVSSFLWILQFNPSKITPRYNWIIVESGFKHHNPCNGINMVRCSTIHFTIKISYKSYYFHITFVIRSLSGFTDKIKVYWPRS